MWSATNEDKGEILLIEGMVTGGNGLAERVGQGTFAKYPLIFARIIPMDLLGLCLSPLNN